MPGQLFIASTDRDYLRILEDWSKSEGFVVNSPQGSPEVDFSVIQESDFVVVPVLEYASDIYNLIYAGYALGSGKPLIVVLGSDTEELPSQLRTAFAVSIHEEFVKLLRMLKPLCGLSLLSEKIAEEIALIQEEFGVK